MQSTAYVLHSFTYQIGQSRIDAFRQDIPHKKHNQQNLSNVSNNVGPTHKGLKGEIFW